MELGGRILFLFAFACLFVGTLADCPDMEFVCHDKSNKECGTLMLGSCWEWGRMDCDYCNKNFELQCNRAFPGCCKANCETYVDSLDGKTTTKGQRVTAKQQQDDSNATGNVLYRFVYALGHTLSFYSKFVLHKIAHMFQ